MSFVNFEFKDLLFLAALIVALIPMIRDFKRSFFKRSKYKSANNPYWIPRASRVINKRELLKRPPIPPRPKWNTNPANPPGGGRPRPQK
jgi:hypothetical protein